MRTIIMASLLLAAAGCDRPAEDPKNTALAAPMAEAERPSADNTKVNERDRGDTLTPMDQGESEADRTITQSIRQGVMKNDALSMTAKNVKIITTEGVVTLRGPVKSDQEKSQIAALAQGIQGVKRVDNQLEVAAN